MQDVTCVAWPSRADQQSNAAGGSVVLGPVATTISKAKWWLCCAYLSLKHRQSRPIMRAQVRAKQLLNVPVPNRAHALSSRRQGLYCCRVPGQPWAQTAVNLP